MIAVSRHGRVGAPDVVLLHPIATSSVVWSAQIASWSQHYRIHAVDLAGHGASAESATTLEQHAAHVATALAEVRSAAFVGLSFGGMVAQAFALAHPTKVRALVVANSSGVTPPPVAQLWDERLAQATEHGMASQVAPTLARWFSPEFALRSPATLEWVGRLISTTPLDGYRGAIRSIQGLDHARRVRELGKPTLLVGGTRDAALPPPITQALAETLNAELVMLEAAHLSNVEQRDAFSDVVGEFLARQLV